MWFFGPRKRKSLIVYYIEYINEWRTTAGIFPGKLFRVVLEVGSAVVKEMKLVYVSSGN